MAFLLKPSKAHTCTCRYPETILCITLPNSCGLDYIKTCYQQTNLLKIIFVFETARLPNIFVHFLNKPDLQNMCFHIFHMKTMIQPNNIVILFCCITKTDHKIVLLHLYVSEFMFICVFIRFRI